ncbi:MAG: glycosyltransferase, partial [Verrucomicrobiaceae bacterium]|nr:glycosyltransferase [Verrucomicrobiaceae bacterium]
MKILLASSSSGSRGGGEIYLVYLAQALRLRGHTPALWASTHPRMDELAKSFAAIGQVHRSPYINTYDRSGRSLTAFLDRRVARELASEWQRIAPDLVHLNKQNLEDGLEMFRAAELAGLPSLATVHLTQSAKYLRARFAWLRDAVARRAFSRYPGMLVTVLDERRRDLEQFLAKSSRCRTVQNGVPLVDLTMRDAARAARRHELGLDQSALLVIAVGRMVSQKRPLLFLEHVARLHQLRPDARCIWIGDGLLSQAWDRAVAERGLHGAVQRLPWQSDPSSFLLAGDLFLHVAEFEGLPLAVLEAMSAGLPCAITANLRAEMPFLDESNSVAVDDQGAWIAALA